MPIPDFQTLMLPFLTMARDNVEHSSNDFIGPLADMYQLTQEERSAMLASGTQRIFHNRVHWAKAYLKMAGLIENTRRGYFKISERGQQVLNEKPDKITIGYLKRFPDFQVVRERKKESISSEENFEDVVSQTPQEQIEHAFNTIDNALGQELLQKIKNCSWRFFEQLVVDLLLKMGYGGSKTEAASVIGRSGDEGIDGVIKEDRLGLDVIYVQAKKWDATIGRPEIQKFVGALAGQGAKKGVFITTSKFSTDATTYLPKNETKVILIDGQKLVELMIEFELGVSIKEVYKLKITDDDYFIEE